MTDTTGKFRTVHARLAKGRTKIYYYTKPGGTKFYDCFEKPIEPPYASDFLRAFREAIKSERDVTCEGDVASIILDYLESPKFKALAAATKEGYQRDLKLARDAFGSFGILDVEDRVFRGKIVQWHEDIAARSPRRADLCVIALSSALGYAYRRGVIVSNPALGIQHAWKRPDDKRPWTEGEVGKFLAGCPPATRDIFLLAMYTGMRRQDLAAITWDAYSGRDIQWKTSKSNGRRTIIVPLTLDGKKFIDDLKRRQLSSVCGLQRTMLLSSGGRSMTAHTLGKRVNQRAKKLGIEKTLHRHRNTYATLLVKAEFEPHEIAGILGWSVEEVHQLIRIYVHRDVIVAAQVERLHKAADRRNID